MERRDRFLIFLLVWTTAAIIAGIAHFVFGAPWWLAIVITVIAVVVNGWIAG